MLICFKCKWKIKDKQYMEVNEKTYHVHHFRCETCDVNLAGKEVHQGKMKNGKLGIFCKECYSSTCYPICEECGGVINGQYYESFGKYYHHEHFCCGRCGGSLGIEYRRSNGRPVCEPCFGFENNDKCKECGLLIEGKRCTVGDDIFHDRCFKCVKCKRMIGKGKIIAYKNRPYHEKCFLKYKAPKCAFCKGKIVGDYLISKKTNKKIHMECLEFYKKMT